MLPLSVFWFLYFAGLGVFFPFYTLYLREQGGLSGTEVGIVLAVMPMVGMVAQPLWGQVADRTGARSTVLALLTAGTALGFLALTGVRGFLPLAGATAALAVCGTAVVPVALSVTFAALRDRGPHAFGLVRVWGTLGYLLAVAAFPIALHRVAPPAADGSEPGLALLFPVTAACTLAAAAVWPWLPRGGDVALRAPRGEWRLLLGSLPVRRLLLFSLGGYLLLQGPTALFPLFVRDRGGDLETVGRMWVMMLLLEVPLVAFAGTGLRRLGARGLLAIGVLAGGLRWLLCGLSRDLPFLYAVQLLHGVVVAGLLLGGPLYLEQVVPARLRSTAQALLSTIGVALGGIVSNIGSGWLIDRYGVDAPFLAGGLGAIALGAAAWWILPPPASPHGERQVA